MKQFRKQFFRSSHKVLHHRYLLPALFCFLLLADTGYSFLQFYHTPFDGDMAGGIVPAEDVKPVLSDPLGFAALFRHAEYPNPNRFFCHWLFFQYFSHVPHLFQSFTTPLESAYLSCALAKILIQVCLILLLSLYITGTNRSFRMNGLTAAVLIVPLFQTNGYSHETGLIDPSTTYSFFYALPAVFRLLYFLPLFLKQTQREALPKMKFIRWLWIPLALVCSLSGALNPGISLIIVLLLLIQHSAHYFRGQGELSLSAFFRSIPNEYWFYLIPVSVFSVYSLLLGQYNSVNHLYELSLSESYLRLPRGLLNLFTKGAGFSLIFLACLINYTCIQLRFRKTGGKMILHLGIFLGLFSLSYLLLLPFGGYRDYRPYLLRYDTSQPIILALIIFFGTSSLFLLKHLSTNWKRVFCVCLVSFLCIFSLADRPEFHQNRCEKSAILEIARSSQTTVRLEHPCNVLSWEPVRTPEASAIKGALLYKWGITSTLKKYYQVAEESPGETQNSLP